MDRRTVLHELNILVPGIWQYITKGHDPEALGYGGPLPSIIESPDNIPTPLTGLEYRSPDSHPSEVANHILVGREWLRDLARKCKGHDEIPVEVFSSIQTDLEHELVHHWQHIRRGLNTDDLKGRPMSPWMIDPLECFQEVEIEVWEIMADIDPESPMKRMMAGAMKAIRDHLGQEDRKTLAQLIREGISNSDLTTGQLDRVQAMLKRLELPPKNHP